MDWIWEVIRQQGPLVLLLCLGIWALLTGKVITRGHHDDVVKDRDNTITKGETREAEWRRIALGLTETQQELAPDVREVLRQRREVR